MIVSDPWELGEVAFLGDMVARRVEPAERALMKLDVPFEHAGSTYKYLVVVPRHEGYGLERVKAGEDVPCNATGVPGDPETTDDAFDYLSSWRGGGLAVIGSISLA
ncbi:MAG: hypothetical protein ACREKN_07005 [Longimicrobiaceae bacterium]